MLLVSGIGVMIVVEGVVPFHLVIIEIFKINEIKKRKFTVIRNSKR